jgi:GNAT superfamily N-acetyltransferase
MLANFQSEKAITEQIRSGVEYYLLKDDTEYSGYIAIDFNMKDSEAKLSKFYVKKSKRRKGIGKKALQFAEQRCRELGIKKLRLTVNKYNSDSIAVYNKLGFENKGSIVQDIGQGFVMDDYKMEKRINNT